MIEKSPKKSLKLIPLGSVTWFVYLQSKNIIYLPLMQVAFYTLGCKLNYAETSTIARKFLDEGFQRVCFEDKADIYVINTCSVTENADNKFKSVVRQALKKNNQAFVIAIGCYAQLQPESLADVDGVDLVLGATEKFNVTAYINDLSKAVPTQIHTCSIKDADNYIARSCLYRASALFSVCSGSDRTISTISSLARSTPPSTASNAKLQA